MRLFNLTIIALALCLGSSLNLQAEEFNVDTGHSTVIWGVKHLGLGYTFGRFNKFTGTINYDAAKPNDTAVSLNIDVASIDSNDKKRDDHLRNADFFDAGTYPSITFKSSKVTAITGKTDTLSVTGDLTMHGTTKSITFEVVKTGEGTHPMAKKSAVGFIANFSVKRSDFGVGAAKYAQALGDDVKLTIALEAIAK